MKKSVNTIRGITLDLLSLVSYQKNSVISREIIKGESGTVTLFAFDKNEGLSEHTAPFDAMVMVLDGSVKICINKKPHLLKKGRSIIMPARQPHSLKAVERFKMLLILIKK